MQDHEKVMRVKSYAALAALLLTANAFAVAVTPPTGASSSDAASVSLVAQNRAVDATAKSADRRWYDSEWTDVLPLFSSLPSGTLFFFR